VKILALDTSTDVCSVALLHDSHCLERRQPGRRHSELLLSLINQILSEAGLTLQQLDGIAFGRGPGQFTGLRIGAGVAQGLAFGADLPVVAISSLAALAQGLSQHNHLLCAFDARMSQIYWAYYRRQADGLVILEGREQLSGPAAVTVAMEPGWVGCGSGWDVYADDLAQRLGAKLAKWIPRSYPPASAVARLAEPEFVHGRVLKPADAIPTYLRDDVATKAGAGR
jgi:tRNA threonylcarbamoyladenosine biosynthesis protein TsaB